MSTGARGERVIETEAGEVRVLFTNRALAGAEAELGRGVIGVLQEFATEGRLGDVAVLLKHGMEAARRDAREGGRPVTLAAAYDVLDEVGFAEATAAVMEAAAAVLGHSRDGDAPAEEDADPN